MNDTVKPKVQTYDEFVRTLPSYIAFKEHLIATESVFVTHNKEGEEGWRKLYMSWSYGLYNNYRTTIL